MVKHATTLSTHGVHVNELNGHDPLVVTHEYSD